MSRRCSILEILRIHLMRDGQKCNLFLGKSLDFLSGNSGKFVNQEKPDVSIKIYGDIWNDHHTRPPLKIKIFHPGSAGISILAGMRRAAMISRNSVQSRVGFKLKAINQKEGSSGLNDFCTLLHSTDSIIKK